MRHSKRYASEEERKGRGCLFVRLLRLGRRRRTCRPSVSCLIVEGGPAQRWGSVQIPPLSLSISQNSELYSKYDRFLGHFYSLYFINCVVGFSARGRKSRRGERELPPLQGTVCVTCRRRRDGSGGSGGPGLTLRQREKRAGERLQQCTVAP